MKVVDANGQEVPRGEVGELIVRGPNVMLGYWNKPEETARALRDGWLYTGDGARMDEGGHVFIVDRLKDMIVSGGENVYSAEVENVIARHPAVQACAVIAVPHAQWGEAVHAVVVRKPGAQARRRRTCTRTAVASSRATSAPRASSSARPCRCRRRARCSSASCASRIGRGSRAR